MEDLKSCPTCGCLFGSDSGRKKHVRLKLCKTGRCKVCGVYLRENAVNEEDHKCNAAFTNSKMLDFGLKTFSKARGMRI